MIGKKISTRCIGLSSVSFLLPRRKRWTFSTEVFAQNASLKDMLEFYESGLVMRAYEKYRTSVAVAQKLGISQATAVRKIHKYAGRDVE